MASRNQVPCARVPKSICQNIIFNAASLKGCEELTFLFSPFMTIHDMLFAEGFAGASGEMKLTA